MDSIITVRYFQVEKAVASAPDFEVALETAFDLGPSPIDRQRSIKNDVVLRLERFKTSGAFIAGEAVRVQTDNIPPEAKDTGLVPLNIGGLGHAVAFRYHPDLEVIAVQFDNRSVSIGKLIDYLSFVDPSCIYRVHPLVTQNAWDRYNDGNPRKFEIQIAAPANLAAVEGEVGALTDAGRTLGEMSDAPMIRIEVSMGNKRKGFLNKGFVTDVLKYFTSGEGKNEDIRSLRATVKDSSEEASDAIDFLNEKLFRKDKLRFNGLDANAHYNVRDSFLKTCFSDHFEYISEVYG